jgi:hypothetical protein
MKDLEDVAAIQSWAEQRRLPKAHLEHWLAFPPEGRAALLRLAVRLKIRTGQMIAIIGLLEEIAVRDGTPVAAILETEPVLRALASAGSAPERVTGLLEALRHIRFPRLARYRAELDDGIAALALPPSLEVRLPASLSSDELEVRLVLRSAEELDGSLAALNKARDALAEIIGRLGGGDGV